MAGQLESTIVEIRNVYDLFMSLRNINPNQSPACVVECLEKLFGNGNRNRSEFTSGDETQIKVMKNLQTSYQVYQKLAILCPKSAPDTLIETLGAILKSSNLVRAETVTQPTISYARGSTSFAQQDDTRADKLGSSMKIINVKSLQNRNDGECQDNEPQSNLDDALVLNEEVRKALPSTSFSSLHKQRQQRVKKWVLEQPSPISAATATLSSNQEEENNSDDDVEVVSQNNLEYLPNDGEEIASNGDSSASSGFSFLFNQNEQQNSSGIQATPGNKKVYKCRYGCGKTYCSFGDRSFHEKIHSGVGLYSCEFCDRQFASRQNCSNHQTVCLKRPPAVVKETIPSTSSIPNQRDQGGNNAMEIDSQNTAHPENIQNSADEIASNGGSSAFNEFLTLLNQTEQQNGSGMSVTPENETVFECRYDGCEKTYVTWSGRYHHEKLHSGIGLIDCDFCDRQFTTRQHWSNHRISFHNQPPAAQKPRQKHIPSSVKRISRIRKQHAKPFSCEFCHNKFADLQSFEKHRRNYPVERLKKCRFPPCAKKYCFESHLLRHEKNHSKL